MATLFDDLNLRAFLKTQGIKLSSVRADSKWCNRCKENKPISDFARNARLKGGRQTTCRPCMNLYGKALYLKKKPYYLRMNLAARLRRRAEIQQEVKAIKENPCQDCGKQFLAYCMDFDHRDPATKYNNVSWMVERGMSRTLIFREIAKCDLVCVYCHRERDHITRSKKRGSVPSETARRDRIYVEAHQKAKSCPCVDCEEKFPYYQMEFDHRSPAEKTMRISSLVRKRSMQRLSEEILKCDAVCVMCHRIRSHNRDEWKRRRGELGKPLKKGNLGEVQMVIDPVAGTILCEPVS